eukprot:TRINITY_DN2663_c0_g2_i1.p1 TRINITY_DN2663_c0_g2~~TRINITY_DN2663_c0_g2_i1.p1  ORF type:complete len:841 (-),score=102.50 TRINITY_DN2663_c0_g2_i1:5-2527(-)
MIPRSSFSVARSPLGWNLIDEMSFYSTGYSLPPQDPTLGLYFDLFELADSPVGQALSDVDFLTRHLNLLYPGLEAVKAAVQANDTAGALSELAAYYKARTGVKYYFDPFTFSPSTSYTKSLADSIVDGYFSSLGITFKFPNGSAIDWNHVEPSQPEWNVNLNRQLDSFDQLGRAYWVTRNATYSRTWANQLRSFINTQTVPPVRSNNYGSSWRTIDTGLRMEIAWPRAWYRFINVSDFSSDLVVQFVKSIWEHGTYLSSWPSTDGNWLAHEMAGLYSLAAFWPELNIASSWRELALDKMTNRVIAEQLLPDGCHYELSSGYHLVTVSKIRSIYDTANITQLYTVPSSYLTPLQKSYQWLIKIMLPSGTNPFTQDSWPNDYRSTMQSALPIWPSDTLLAWVAGNRRNNSLIPNFTSLALPDSGFVIFRSGWNTSDNWAMMDVGQLGEGGHAHEDKLNIQIAPYGRYLMHDGDGGDYTSTESRKFAMASFSHSVLIVDNLPQVRNSEPTDLQGNDINSSALLFDSTPSYDYSMAAYLDAFGNASYFPVKHQREFIFYKNSNPQFWLVVDTIASADGRPHEFDIRWQFDTNRSSALSNGGFMTTDAYVPNLAVIPLYSSASTATTSHSWEGYGGPMSGMLGVSVRRNKPDSPGLTVRSKTVATAATTKVVHLFVPIRANESLAFSAIDQLDSFTRRISFGGTTLTLNPVSNSGAAIKLVIDVGGASSSTVFLGPSTLSPGASCFKSGCNNPSVISVADLNSLIPNNAPTDQSPVPPPSGGSQAPNSSPISLSPQISGEPQSSNSPGAKSAPGSGQTINSSASVLTTSAILIQLCILFVFYLYH